ARQAERPTASNKKPANIAFIIEPTFYLLRRSSVYVVTVPVAARLPTLANNPGSFAYHTNTLLTAEIRPRVTLAKIAFLQKIALTGERFVSLSNLIFEPCPW